MQREKGRARARDEQRNQGVERIGRANCKKVKKLEERKESREHAEIVPRSKKSNK